MNDTVESSAQEGAQRWLLLMHRLPLEPAYVRVKVRRRLARLGAVALKKSAYVLPDTEANLEDFQWLANEIIGDGGEAVICSATMLSGVSDRELNAVFGAGKTPPEPRLPASTSAPRGAVWVTRRDVFVDRIASAWLIRKFIDPAAQFRFVARGYKRNQGELRFDMYHGEYTHEGDRCTFETLLRHFGLKDPALNAIAEIVHDIDLKDDKFGRAESRGIESVLRGITYATDTDAERLERGALVFNGLYEQLKRGP